MNIIEKIVFKILKSQGWMFSELSDSWNDALISKVQHDPHSLMRMYNAAMQADTIKMVLDKYNIDLVIDVGANHGTFGRKIRQLGFQGAILSVEPNPVVFELLTQTAKNDHEWYVQNVGIGSEAGKLELFTTVDSSFASTKKPNQFSQHSFGDNSLVTGSEMVDICPLLDVFNGLCADTQQTFSHVFLKSDTQGMDREVIRSCGKVLDCVDVFMVEMPLKPIYEDMPKFEELYHEYVSLGYELVNISPVSWGPDMEMIEIDCVFQSNRNV